MSDLDKIKEALEFYSDESKYNTPLYDKSDLNNVGMPFPDKGHQAREALNLLESTIAEEKRLREALTVIDKIQPYFSTDEDKARVLQEVKMVAKQALEGK